MMKKVIFIFLLSLSMCLSRAENTPGAVPAAVASKDQTQNQPEVKANASTTVLPAPETHPPAAPEATVTENTNRTAAPPSDTKPNKTQTDENKTKPAKKDTDAPKVKEEDEKNRKSDKATDSHVDKTADKNATKSEDNHKEPEPHTEEHDHDHEDCPKKEVRQADAEHRGFDGLSFFGGIILSLGVLAIGFIAYRYHKSQTERNYHTL